MQIFAVYIVCSVLIIISRKPTVHMHACIIVTMPILLTIYNYYATKFQ